MKVSKKARHGRRRHPLPHGDHHNVGATQDPLVRARRVGYRRARLAAALADFLLGQGDMLHADGSRSADPDTTRGPEDPTGSRSSPTNSTSVEPDHE